MTLIVWAGILVSLPQAEVLGQKVWTQTTEKDFNKGQRDSVAITKLEDGEVQLPHPLVRTRDESIDNSVLRFAVYDDSGNYLRLWIEDEVLLAGKYSPNGTMLIPPFQVNTDTLEERIWTYNGCFNDKDQGFVIIWSGQVQSDQDNKYFIFVQFFDSTGTPIGHNQPVNETALNRFSKPSAFLGDFENYWIFWDQGDRNKNAIYYQKYSISGEKIDINRQLNPENYFKYEYYPLVARNSRREFVVAWSTTYDKELGLNHLDIYLRFFDKEGVPKGPPQRVHDYQGEFEQRLTDICMDRHDNLLLVWLDRRGITVANFYQVYAQLYDADGVRLNRNRRIAAVNPYHSGGLRAADIVLLPDGQFQISWEGWHMSDEPWTSEVVVNQWKIVKVLDGDFTSSIFDAGPGGADWQTLNWSEDTDTNLTTIRFKIRSSQTLWDIETTDWFGPTSPADFYTSSAGQAINFIHDGDRYVQYKAFLATQIPGTTPILKDVSLWFTTLDSIAPQTPTGFSAQEELHQIRISWAANNEPDLKMYKLYRGRVSQDYDIYWTKEISTTRTSYLDTNVVPGTTYFYAISAVDSNMNESPLSAEVVDSPLGRHFYVDGQAAPSGEGSFAHPFSTISAGLEKAIFGDTVNVLPGSYTESVLIGKGVALVGSGANLTRIEGPAAGIVVQCGDSSLVKGFTIITNSDARAIRCNRASPLITENVLVNCGDKYNTGIHLLTYSLPRITKNIISSFAIGIRDLDGYGETRPGYIRNNIIVDCLWDAIQTASSDIQIINNTIVQTGGCGIRFLSGTDVLVMNNIICHKNQQYGIGIDVSFGSITCKYNNVFSLVPYGGCEPGEGSISAEPLFRQEQPNDYRLQPDSPGVDAGNPAPEFNDRDDSRNDMGAFGGPDPIDEEMFIENALSIIVSNASGFPGDSITVSVSLSKLGGVCQMRFDFTYDENLLDAVDVVKTEITRDFQLDWEESPGKVTLDLESTSEIIQGTGEIVIIHFVIDTACVAGQASPLSLENIRIDSFTGDPFRILQVTDGAFIVHLGSAGGRYVFVDQDNSGFEDGSRNFPYQTISGGILRATAGDTVLVAAGDYNEKLEMRENVFVKGMGALVTRLFSEEGTVVFHGVNQSGISGFTLETTGGGMFTIECYQSSPFINKNKIIGGDGMGVGIECHDSSNPAIFNNLIQCRDEGVWIWCYASHPHIYHNTFRSGDFGFSGIKCAENSKPIIEQNTFYGVKYGRNIISSRNASPQIIRNKFYCGEIDSSAIEGFTSPELQIFNNIILVDGEMGSGIRLHSCQDANVVNNTVYSDGGTAIQVRESSWLNMNNIFVGSDFEPFDISEPPPITYSAFWDFAATMTDTLPGIGNIVSDPQFVSLPDQNYRLALNSPCIDAGNPASEYNDLDGSRNDMGAYGGPFADSSSFESQQAILTILSAEAAPGNLAVLPVESHFVAGVAEINLTITYDQSVLSIEDVKTSDLTKSFSLTTDFSGNDSVGIALISHIGINSEQGSLIQVVFKVSADADTGKSTPVSIKRASLRSEVSVAIGIGEMNSGHISISGDPSNVPQNNSSLMPRDFQLSQNYPNPFNSETRIRYGLPNQKVNYGVSIRIYNILGQLMRNLIHKTQLPGYYTITWDGKDDQNCNVPSGIYVCVFKAGEVRRVRKMLVLK